ncbi:MAG TPA: response regulator [Roseiflexaceae bacterium]|nr:response regulator [Roseiflexaceae bacterium]
MRPIILVIEEDPDLGRLFESMLELEGYSVVLARTVQEAQELIDRREPDLIVFDWQLSNASGYIWVDQMRSSDATAHIPILLVCGALPPRIVYEMLGNAGVPVVEKPFDLLVFSRHVAALLRPHDRAVGAV